MTTYTAIADADIDPESPITTTLMTRLRDNPIAITEGASGAPNIQTAAITDLAVTTAKINTSAVTTVKIADSNVTTNKLESGERMTTANVIAATAGASIGSVGTYAFLINNTGGALGPGATATAASGLAYSDSSPSTGATPSGTWRSMGNCNTGNASLFLRIS